MRHILKKFILLALNQCDGVPMPEGALVQAAKNLSRPAQPTDADVLDALHTVEADGYVIGATDDIAGRQWTLTTKGVLKARQLA